MISPTWAAVTALAARFRTEVGGVYDYVAAAHLHDHRSLNQPESEHDMTDAREAAIAARIEESPPSTPSEIALDIAGFGAGWDAALEQEVAELHSLDEGRRTRIRELLLERDALLARVAAIRAVIATEGNQHEDERNGDTWINRDALNAILAQPPATTLAAHDKALIAQHTQMIMDVQREVIVEQLAAAEVRGYQRGLDERIVGAVKVLTAERDAALAVIEHANSWAINSWGYTEKLQIVEICRALARTPADTLAAHDAEVAAKALEEVGSSRVEWAVEYVTTGATHRTGGHNQFPDRESCERFLENAPLWFDSRWTTNVGIVSRRAASEWTPVTPSTKEGTR